MAKIYKFPELPTGMTPGEPAPGAEAFQRGWEAGCRHGASLQLRWMIDRMQAALTAMEETTIEEGER
jgi:hypothetical protein